MKRHLPFIIYLLSVFMINACAMVKETRKQVETNIETVENQDWEGLYNPLNEVSEETNKDSIPYHETAKRVNDLLHTKLEVSFDWENHYLFGKATLTFKPYFYPSNTLILDAKGFDIHQVALVSKSGNKDLKYDYDSMKLEIALDKTYTKTDTFIIYIHYTAKPDELDQKNEEITYQNKGLYFISHEHEDSSGTPRQIWTQGETESSSCWFPTIDHPNERTTQEISITVPENFLTLSNGKLMSSTNNPDGTRTDYWKQTSPHAPYLFAMAIDEYVLIKDKWRNIEVNYYLDSLYAHLADNIFGNTPEMLEFFSNKLNYPYPWDKYSQAIVYNFVAGAMENTGATLFYDDLYYYGHQKGKSDDIIAHELFHHWFGDLVTCESWANLPLNESFATYGEYLWFEFKYGKKEADLHLQNDLLDYLDESFTKKEPLIRFYYSSSEDMFDRHSYQKGGRVLHILRNYVGDEAFFTALNLYLRQNAYQSVEIHNLRLAFEEVTGEDLNWFFNQWFLTNGHPVLDITHQYDSLAGKLLIEVLQKQPESTVYRIPTHVDIFFKNGTKERKNILLNQTTQVFEFNLKQKPVNLIFDPDRIILGEIYTHQNTDEFIHQFYNGNHYLDQIETLYQLDDLQSEPVVQKLFADALKNDFWMVQQEALYLLIPSVYSGQGLQLKNAMVDLINSTDNTDLKIMALEKLMEFFGEEKDLVNTYKGFLTNAHEDIFQSVLYYLIVLDQEIALSEAHKLSDTENPKLAFSIASVFAEAGDENDQPYFETWLPKATGDVLYNFIDSYGHFLSRMETMSVVQKGVLTLKNIALSKQDWWIKLIATQQIAYIKDVFTDKMNENPGNSKIAPLVNLSNDTLQSIKSKETNAKLLELYENL